MEENKGRRRWGTAKMIKCDVAINTENTSVIFFFIKGGVILEDQGDKKGHLCVSTPCIFLCILYVTFSSSFHQMAPSEY